jgi:hypothetical protein
MNTLPARLESKAMSKLLTMAPTDVTDVESHSQASRLLQDIIEKRLESSTSQKELAPMRMLENLLAGISMRIDLTSTINQML